jgi:hypothetical protein
MRFFVAGALIGSLFTAGATLGFDSKMWRFGTEARPEEKLDQIQHQHRAILDQQDRLERLLQQNCSGQTGTLGPST